MDVPLPNIRPIRGISGRLWDITKPLFQICGVACPERYDDLLNAILNIANERTQEKKESFDGLLVQVIYEMAEGDAEHFDIPTADVTTRFNELWKGDKPKSKEWTGRRLKALGIPTDTKSRFSMIRLDRKTLNIILTQYGFIEGGEISSKTSKTSQDDETKDDLVFEVLFEDLMGKRTSKKTSNGDSGVNTDSCKVSEVFEDIPTATKTLSESDLVEVAL